MADVVPLNWVQLFGLILLGVAISIVLPVIVKWAVLPAKERSFGFKRYIASIYLPYLKAGIAAIFISIVILVFAPEDLDNWETAVLLGFGWQSFLKNLQP
jgi:hypothetical protein